MFSCILGTKVLTVKALVAITPNDTFITNGCDFLTHLEHGDEVLANKGFPGIKISCENKNSVLVITPVGD